VAQGRHAGQRRSGDWLKKRTRSAIGSRESLEAVRQEREFLREAAETARGAAEEARSAAEAARQAAIDAVHATAETLQATVEHMKVVEDAAQPPRLEGRAEAWPQLMACVSWLR
jgi:hypothetical protein